MAMNKEKLSWGLILLFVGGILLLDNLDIIHFYWWSVFSMWPVILIVIGMNLLVPRRGMGNVISIIVTMAALAFLAYRGTFPPHTLWWGIDRHGWHGEKREKRASGPEIRTDNPPRGVFTHEYDSAVTTAHLSIKGGAIEYEMGGTTDKLFSAEATSIVGTHSLETTVAGSNANLSFRMKDQKKGKWNLEDGDNWARISLNTRPLWHIGLDMGAGSADFNLTSYRVASLKFKGGAASFEARLGMPLEETVITAESGVASVEIEIPRAAACRIVVKSGLSSRDFPGFIKQADGSYVTEGYEGSGNRFTINLQGGLSSFTVNRYD